MFHGGKDYTSYRRVETSVDITLSKPLDSALGADAARDGVPPMEITKPRNAPAKLMGLTLPVQASAYAALDRSVIQKALQTAHETQALSITIPTTTWTHRLILESLAPPSKRRGKPTYKPGKGKPRWGR